MTIIRYWKHRDAATAIIRHESHPLINADVAGFCSLRWLRVQSSEKPGLRIDGKSSESPARLPIEFVQFVNCIQEVVVCRNGQKRWIDALGCTNERQRSCCRIHPIDEDAVRVGCRLGVSSDINHKRLHS